MDESRAMKTLVRERARERRRSCGDNFGHAHPIVPDRDHKLQQTIVAGMRRRGPFGLVEPPVLAIIVMQPPEFQLRFCNRTHQLNNFAGLALFDSGSIHTRIYIDKNAD